MDVFEREVRIVVTDDAMERDARPDQLEDVLHGDTRSDNMRFAEVDLGSTVMRSNMAGCSEVLRRSACPSRSWITSASAPCYAS